MMTVQKNMAISNPRLADRILRFLLSEETTAFPARVLSQRVSSTIPEVEAHIIAINQIKARWIYEIPQPDGKESFYIIGNCKMQIKEYLRRGGFERAFEPGVAAGDGRFGVMNSVLGANNKIPVFRKVAFFILAAALVVAAYLCLTCL